jgi:multidrug resistance efflux pump
LGANATLVLTLGDIDKVFVRGKVDEADIGRVRLAQHARITTETFRDRVFAGRVTQISPIGVEKGQRHDLRGRRCRSTTPARSSRPT